MTHDAATKDEFQNDWAALSNLVRSRGYMGAGGTFIVEGSRDELYNLQLVLAFSLLDEVLEELTLQGTIRRGRNNMLGTKMEDSKCVLPWQDFNLVYLGKTVRNELAHQGRLAPKEDCIRFVAAIGDELRAWKIL